MRMIVCEGCGQSFQDVLFGDHPCSALKAVQAWMTRHGLIPERTTMPSPEAAPDTGGVTLDPRWLGLMGDGAPGSHARDVADYNERMREAKGHLRGRPPE